MSGELNEKIFDNPRSNNTCAVCDSRNMPRSKRHPDKLMRGNEDRRQLHRLDRQGIIHEPLAVAGLELKPAHLALQKRHIGDRTVVDHLHLAVDGIAEQPRAALGIVGPVEADGKGFVGAV